MKSSWRLAGLSRPDQALLSFAEKLTLAPATIEVDDLTPLRRSGLSDRAIHDAVQVIAYFNYINRVASGLGVDLETWMPDTG